MNDIEQEHAQAIDFTQERLKRVESDMAYLRKDMDELKSMLAAFMKAITEYKDAEHDHD